MCTWMTELPQKAKSVESAHKPNLMIYLKPTPPKEYYRFRLLGFRSPKSDRDFPIIERFTHQIWCEDSNGKRHTESIVCPVTPYVKAKWNGDPMNDCPLCKFANANFGAWKKSGWKDRESAKKNRDFGRKFEAIVPVYVVNDPSHPTNNGHLKTISFTDKDEYKKFKELILKYTHGWKDDDGTVHEPQIVFNGKNAVDFYIRYETKEEVKNEGKPNEYHWKHNVIQKMGFSNKPYDIPAITKEAVDDFPFDETYYVSNTLEELNDFFNRHAKVSNDDIPDDDEDIDLVAAKPTAAPKPQVQKTNSIEKTEVAAPVKFEDSVADLPFDDGSETKAEADADIDDLLDEDDEPKAEVKAPVKTEEPKNQEILESPEDPMKTKTSDSDIEALLDGII